jgi:hypothetical protein
VRRADILTAICEPIVYIKCGSLYVSQPYRPSRAVTDSFYLLRIQVRSGAHPASYPMIRGLVLGINKPRSEADHSSPSSDKIKNAGNYTSTSLCLFGVLN